MRVRVELGNVQLQASPSGALSTSLDLPGQSSTELAAALAQAAVVPAPHWNGLVIISVQSNLGQLDLSALNFAPVNDPPVLTLARSSVQV